MKLQDTKTWQKPKVKKVKIDVEINQVLLSPPGDPIMPPSENPGTNPFK